jgi:hypothetical protein
VEARSERHGVEARSERQGSERISKTEQRSHRRKWIRCTSDSPIRRGRALRAREGVISRNTQAREISGLVCSVRSRLPPAGRSGRRRVEFTAGRLCDPLTPVAPLLRFEIRCLDCLQAFARTPPTLRSDASRPQGSRAPGCAPTAHCRRASREISRRRSGSTLTPRGDVTDRVRGCAEFRASTVRSHQVSC